MKVAVIFVALLFTTCFLPSVDSWRRRRRRRCKRDCTLGPWSSWSTCTKRCGSGTRSRTRGISVPQLCGGTCNHALKETQNCNTQCCPVNCVWSWNAWGPCSGCGISNKTRTIKTTRNPSCGGTACPSQTIETISCDTGVCCPVNCVVNPWSTWGGCNAACEKNGNRARSRTIKTQPSCKGTACPTLKETKSCRGPCCPRDCLVSSWSAFGSCVAPPGKCNANSGIKTRSRTISRGNSCGGKACPLLTQTSPCTPVPISCKMSPWSSWSSCSPTNGKCGAGTQYRTRTIATPPYCSSSCPGKRQTRSCTHSCCPVNCVTSSWTAWSACSNTCGSGSKTKTRRVTTNPSCGGNSCPALKQTLSCSQYNNRDCVMSSWTSWSLCSNGCGNGWSTRTRSIVTSALCRGKACGTRSDKKQCTDYRENRDCVVNSWGSWGVCNEKCAVGSKKRTRTIKISKRCQGKDCPALQETSQCGTANNGCQHKCSNGVCSCNSGYTLASDKKKCNAKDCRMPKPTYCAPGTSLSSTCKLAIVTCPGGKTTYPVTCSLGCPKDYSIKGSSTVTCQTSGQWTSYATSYCRRNNDPPTQIILSGSASIQENKQRGTKVGTFSSVDPNSKDKHTYSIVSGGSGKFELRGAHLYSLTVFDYESSLNKFSLVIRSTDNGSPPMKLEKAFTISVTDVNEKPTAIQLSNNDVDENSDVDTVVGMLSTADQDNGQTYTYSMLDGAGGRFKIQSNLLKVAKSNKNCLLNGGSQCLLNYERVLSYSIKVRSVDSGSPSQSVETSFNITLNDINDQPRALQLSNYKVTENAPLNTVVGNLSASDEDKGQKLSFSLVDDDGGKFALDSKGGLYKAKSTDYETSAVHYVVAKVTDNGQPALSMTKNFSIVVLDVNEAPVSIVLDQQSVQENSKPGTKVGTLTAIDTDAVQNLTFKLDDDAAGKFSLQPNTSCQNLASTETRCTTDLVVSGAINYEDASSSDIIVRVTDDKGLFHTERFNVTVTDVNDPPTNVTLDGSASAWIPENSKNVQIDTLLTEDEDQGQSYTYVLTNNPGRNFEIRGDKLFASKNANLDFESSSSFQISVKSTDNGSPPESVEISLVINLLDVNERPTKITLSNRSVQENKPPGTVIGQLTVTDPDRQQSHVCSLTDSANGKAGISNNNLTVGSAGVNYEEASSFSVKILCRDAGGLTVEETFVVLVQDVNEKPTSIVISNNKIQENQQSGTVVAFINVTDPDNANTQVQTFSFSVPSSQPFVIQNNALVTARVLDFENSAQWTVSITATDSGRPALSLTEVFTIQVIDVNDAPNGITLSSSAVDENSDKDTLIGTLTALDQDTSQKHTFQLLNSSSGRFKVDGNKLKVAISNKQCLSQGGSSCLLNYEAQKRYLIRVKTTDDGTPQQSFEKDFSIDLRDVNDKPRDLQLSNNKVKENANMSTLIGTFTSNDEDTSQQLTYSLSNDDSGRFRVDSQGRLYKAKDTDYETQTSHIIRAVVKDNGNPSMKMEKSFTIEVMNVNEAPISINITSQGGQLTFPDGHAQIRENSATGTVIGKLQALDQDAVQTLVFRLDDDAGGAFTLGSSAGCQTITNIPGVNTRCTIDLKLNGALDYETSKEHHITVRVTDKKGLFTTEQLKISILDQNDAPENVTLSGSYTASVNENTNNALVGQLVTTDQDVAQSHTYKLLDDAAGRFVILNDKLYVSSSANLDYEVQKSFMVKVQSNDSGTPSLGLVQDFQITVLDVNEAPVNITLVPANITENSQPGTAIGQLTVSDPDNYGPRGKLQTHTCQVAGNQIGKFVIQSNVLAVGSASIDYELASVISVKVKCTDTGSPPLSLVTTLFITVIDINEAPTAISLSSAAIAENQPPSLIGLLSTSDPDNANQPTDRQTFTYKFMGNTAGLPFVIDGDALNSTSYLNFEARSSWNITVQSLDSGDPQLSVVTGFQISVKDVNEKPFNLTLSNTFVDENAPQDTVVGQFFSQDPDRAQTHTYTLTDGAGGRFKVVGSQLKVALSNVDCLKNGGPFCKLNYEKQPSYTVTVRVTDNGSPPQSNETSMSISLNDVNDRPRDFKLSSRTVKENATIGTKIGRFTATDEDEFQTLTFSLTDSDGGRFAIDSSGYLFKNQSTDYETNKAHKIVAQVIDNGTVPLKVTKTFTIVVENVNEAPINTTITSALGQQSFPDNVPKVNENTPVGETVGTLQALDHDEVQNLTFSLDDDANGKFIVGSPVTCHNITNIPGVKTKCTALLQVSGELNFETDPSEDILVRVTDASGLFHVQPFQVAILDVNDAPSNIVLAGGDTAFIDENVNNGYVGDLATTDEDVNQTHSYSLINNGGWKFVLRNNKIYSSRSANLDYEGKSNYTIGVRSTDNGNPRLSFDKTFTVQVLDVNERPTGIVLSSTSVPENSPKGTLVSNITVVDPDNKGPRGSWQNHSCRILNPSNNPFMVNGTENSLVVTGGLNYENKKSYRVYIRCFDSGNPPLSVDKIVQIQVTDVNEAPYDITLSNNEVAENAGIVTVGRLDTADPDNEQSVVQTFSYSIVDPSGSVPFVIANDVLNTTGSLDYEARTTWSLVIKSVDNKGLSTTKNFTLVVQDRNDPPTNLTTSGPLSVYENSLSGEYIGSLTTVDQDVAQKHQYKIVDVVARGHRTQSSSSDLLNFFTVESPSGRVTLQKSGLDYEQYANYTVTVNSTDSGYPPYSVTGSFVVNVKNANEQPQNISLTANQVPENSPVGTVVGYLSVYDPDNLHVTLQKFLCSVSDGGPFKVVNNVTLVVAQNTLDYEVLDLYVVNVSCTELLPNPLSVSALFIINVQDVNEAPYNLTISSTTVKENGLPGDIVGRLSVLDPDSPTSGQSNVSLVIKDQSPDSKALKLIGDSLLATRSLDFETQSSYNVTIVATDSGNPPLSTSLTVTIEVIDVNDPPSSISLVSKEIYENATAGTVVGELQAHDEDVNQSHYFQLISSQVTDAFTVDGNQLVHSNVSLNHETTPVINVTINATDNGSPRYSVQDVLFVTVLDSNDAPSDIIFSSSLSAPDNTSFSVVLPENSPSGTSLANLSVVDEDASQQHNCELLDGGNYFYISSVSKSSSEIRVKQGVDLNYESHPGTPIQVAVKCEDNGSPPYSVQRNFSVQLSDVNEAPFDIRLNGSAVVEENVRVGYVIGFLTCKDPDIGQNHTFTVIGNYSSVFRVNSDNYLVVKDPSYLNYENLHPPVILTVIIQATDQPPEGTGPALDVTSDFPINVTDVNEAPYDVRLIPENVTVPENVSIGYCLAQVTSTNPERSQTVHYTLLNFRDTFSLENKCRDNSSGVSQGDSYKPYLTVKSHLSYNDYVIRAYQILIEAEDNGIPPEAFNGTVNVHVTKVDPCAWSSCPAHSTCSRVDWHNYTCPCNEGFKRDGRNCTEIDECDPNPCSHGGTCHDYVNYYNCTCPSGYHNGSDCTFINYCHSKPCQHDSACNPLLNGYKCYCSEGYEGDQCQNNINDCKVEPCAEGECVDGIASFTCDCWQGYYGPQCQRKSEDCKPGPCEKQEFCIPSNIRKYNLTQCVPNDFVISLKFLEGENISSPYWQYRLEDWILGIDILPLGQITDDEYDSTMVSADDVYIISPSLEHEARAKRSAEEERSSKVDFIVLVYSDEKNKFLAVPPDLVLCGMNNTCIANGLTSDATPPDFYYKLCRATANEVDRLGIPSCVVKEPKEDAFLKDQKHSTSKRLYYVIGGIGGLLLIVIITGLILCRRNTLSEKQRKSITHERHRESDDSYTDTMYRHRMANQQLEDEVGALNPIYGNAEEEVVPQLHMMDNPLYLEPEAGKPTVKRSESARGFDNPMYRASITPENQPLGEGKDKEEGAAKSTGYANPMFTSYREEKKKSEAKQDESALYSVPFKPDKSVAKESKTPIYDSPKKPDKPVVQEPEENEAPGFFNPLYQTRREVQQFPEDISSIFASPSPPPVQALYDDELGQSEC